MKKYLITNLVYGDLYLKIFLERHLKSLLDDTNFTAIAPIYECEYRIFTDMETEPKLRSHPTIKRLASLCRVELVVFEFSRHVNSKFEERYRSLVRVFHESVRYALEQKIDYVTAWVADLVVAREFFPRIMRRMEEGHDAVFVLPLRSSFESTALSLNQVNRALTDIQLFELGMTHLHPLWVACHWGNPSFTRMPYTLLWRTRYGLLARSFSVTPIIFKPMPVMIEGAGGMIDGDIPRHFKNPYWCEDWTDAPVIGIEPLFCHYPPFGHHGCYVRFIKQWAFRTENPPIHPTQAPFLKKHLYYPNKKLAGASWWTRFKSNNIVGRIV